MRRVAWLCGAMLALVGAAPASAQDSGPAQTAVLRDPADVRRALQAQQSVLSQCFTAARGDNRDFGAILSLSLEVEEDGSVTSARIVEGFVPLGSASSFTDCIVLAARRFELGPGPRETLEQPARFGQPLAPGTEWRSVRQFRLPVIRCGGCGGYGGLPVGALSREGIRRTIRRQRPAVRACYEHELQRNPRLAGRAVVQFVIAPDGSVTTAAVTSSRFGKPEPRLERCLVNIARTMQFPSINGDGLTVVSYPFAFKRDPGSRARLD